MPNTHLHILAEAAPLLASLDLDEALKALERLVVPEIADWCAIHLVDADGDIERVEVAHRDPERVAFALDVQRRYPPAAGGGSAINEVMRTGQGLLVPEVTPAMLEATAQDAEHLGKLRSLGIRSAITVPMRARGRTLGAMTLVTEQGGRVYDEGWLSLAESVAALAALAVHNAELYTDLERSRRHFESILHGIPGGVTVQNSEGGLVFANDAAAKSMGFDSADALLGTPVADVLARFEILDEKGAPFAVERLPGRRALAGEESPAELICFRLRDTGEMRWTRVIARRLDAERGQKPLAVNVMQDVTERIEYERRLEHARSEAEQASAAKTQFLAVVSHELRTPLNAISGFTELLAMQVAGALTPAQSEYLTRIESSARHLTGLIEQILTFSRIETGREDLELEDVDLAAVTGEVAELLEPLAHRKNVRLERSVPATPVRARLDVARLRQILLNLIGNAIKFTDEGAITIELARDGDDHLVHIVDTGLGIPAVEHERIFEPFTQVDASATRRVGGTGLGLAVSRHLARLMGGDILVQSAPGSGSRFTLRLPADASRAPA